MYLFAHNLRDAGEFQKNFDHGHPEQIDEETIQALIDQGQIVSISRGEEAGALQIVLRRCGFGFPDYDSEIEFDTSKVEGIIIALFPNKAQKNILDGDQNTLREIKQSPVSFVLYKVLQAA
jgi:hypothetical protein